MDFTLKKKEKKIKTLSLFIQSLKINQNVSFEFSRQKWFKVVKWDFWVIFKHCVFESRKCWKEKCRDFGHTTTNSKA